MEDTENIEMPIPIDRRALLPVWIKFFIWVFIVMGAVIPVGIVLGILGAEYKIALYGLETQHPFSAIGLFLMLLFLYKGITAFCLWNRNNMAIILGEVDAIIGIAVCIAVMLIFPFLDDSPGFRLNFRGELLLLIPYYIKLRRIKDVWREAKA